MSCGPRLHGNERSHVDYTVSRLFLHQESVFSLSVEKQVFVSAGKSVPSNGSKDKFMHDIRSELVYPGADMMHRIK